MIFGEPTATLAVADADAAAYGALQASWRDDAMSADAKAEAAARALAVPVGLVRAAHAKVALIGAFLPSCNPTIASDAKVGIHLLAGAARAAFQTVLVNAPEPALADELRALLREIREAEDAIL